MTSFSKFEVSGPDAVEFLQKICSANIDKPVGNTVYTGMQNENGGYGSFLFFKLSDIPFNIFSH